MFKWLLISKYLRRKLAPLFAGLAVTICTAMVIIVMSVMGGFLDLLQSSAQKLTGDVTITGPYSGMPYYDELIDELKQMPQVVAATPVVRGYGLFKFYTYNHPVMVEGIRPLELNEVVDFRGTLMWSSRDVFGVDTEIDLKDRAMEMKGGGDPPEPAMIVGIEVNPQQYRDEQGQYDPGRALVGQPVQLTVLPVAQTGALSDTSAVQFIVVNEFKSGLFEIDSNNVYVPFHELQKMLKMNPVPLVDPETFQETGKLSPARTSEVVVKVSPDYDLYEARDAIAALTDKFYRDRPDVPYAPDVETWDQRHATLLSAVKNEKGLVTFLFIIISVVAVVMVATTFYMIVLEKTRDIGVLRAIGASKAGVRNLFLGYGLVIGVLGAILGMGLAALVVTHLNEIQAALKAVFGWQMWNPQVYFFERIPDKVDWVGGAWVMLGAVLSSVAGALVPAIIAARMNPVEALRYE